MGNYSAQCIVCYFSHWCEKDQKWYKGGWVVFVCNWGYKAWQLKWGGGLLVTLHQQSRSRERGQRGCCSVKPQGAPCNPLFPPERPHFISFFSLPKQGYQLGTECPNTRAHKGNFVFKLQLASTFNSVWFSCFWSLWLWLCHLRPKVDKFSYDPHIICASQILNTLGPLNFFALNVNEMCSLLLT